MKAVYGGNAVELTKNEARILWCLTQKDLCTRDELIEDLWTNGMAVPVKPASGCMWRRRNHEDL